MEHVTIRVVKDQEVNRFNELLRKKHYLKNSRTAGKLVRHVAEYKGQWVGLLTWSAAAYHIKARDEWIGWSDDQRRRRLNLLASNSRFLLLHEPGEYPNLATKIMKLSAGRLNEDWLKIHGHGLVAIETFVDPYYYQGSCYKAGNWTELGFTAGYRRKGRDYYEEHERPKRLFVRTLRRDALRILKKKELPEKYAAGEIDVRPVCPFHKEELGSLFEMFKGIDDPRTEKGRRYPLACVLSIATAAVLCQARDYQGIADFSQSLTKPQRRRLRCWKHPVTKEFTAPSRTCFWKVLSHIDPEQLDKALNGWLVKLDQNRAAALAIDGKTVKGAWTSDDSQLHLFAAFSHDNAVVYSQCAVDEKSNEITHVDKLLDDLDIDGKVITADAMHTQRKTAHYLVQGKGADYLFTVKDNQQHLRQKLQKQLPENLFFSDKEEA